MSTFRRPYSVIRRLPGSYANGFYQPALHLPATTIEIGIQPATSSDFDSEEATGAGRRLEEMRRAFTALADRLRPVAQDGSYPGDLVLLEGAQWLVTGTSVRDVLQTDVSHVRHLIVRQPTEAADGTETPLPGPPLGPGQPGTASMQFTGGGYVVADLYPIVAAAPYPLTATSLDAEIGTAGGSFRLALVWQLNGDPASEMPAGLDNVLVNNPVRQTFTIPTAAQVRIATGDRLAFRIYDVAGEPSDTVMTLHFSR